MAGSPELVFGLFDLAVSVALDLRLSSSQRLDWRSVKSNFFGISHAQLDEST